MRDGLREGEGHDEREGGQVKGKERETVERKLPCTSRASSMTILLMNTTSAFVNSYQQHLMLVSPFQEGNKASHFGV